MQRKANERATARERKNAAGERITSSPSPFQSVFLLPLLPVLLVVVVVALVTLLSIAATATLQSIMGDAVEEKSQEIPEEVAEEKVEETAEEEAAEEEEEEAPVEEEEEEEVVDPKAEIEESCKPKCVKQLLALQACEKRVEEDEEGQKHCTGQYFDYWGCIDKCTAPKLFRKLK
nr:hypothetical protein PHYPA_030451 [Physcomitrium patens]